MRMNNINKCSECGIVFKYLSNLRRHAVGFHPGLENKVAPLKRSLKMYPFKCSDCNRQFSHKRHYTYHYNKKHTELSCKQPRARVKCSLCQEMIIKKHFESHVKTVHNVELVRENVEFSSYDACYEWIQAFENNSAVKYVKSFATKHKEKGMHTVRFHCHRSGYYKPSGSGLRRIKTQGTKKINGFCPSRIHVVINGEGKCNVTYLKTHIGHENELHHLTLTKAQRDYLAARIADKVPFDKIISEVKNSANEELGRIHLLTRHDLSNIKQSYNLREEDCKKSIVPDAEYKKYEGASNFEIVVEVGGEGLKTDENVFKRSLDEKQTNLLMVKNEMKDVSIENRKEKVLLLLIDLLNDAVTHEHLDVIENALSCIMYKN